MTELKLLFNKLGIHLPVKELGKLIGRYNHSYTSAETRNSMIRLNNCQWFNIAGVQSTWSKISGG